MYYDPIKNVFAALIKDYPFLRVMFYQLLDIMFLRSWYVRRELKNLRIIFSRKEISIYDAGAGYGQYTYFMAENLKPNKILAVDVKEEWIRDSEEFFKRRGNGNISFGIEDLTAINYTNCFDLIVCVDVMEHIVEDTKVFKNFYNALQKGGYLLINTPSIYGGSDVHGDHDESFIGEHARDGYSAEELDTKLQPLGFERHKAIYSYGFWGDKAWRIGIKYPLKLVNISKVLLIVLPFYYWVVLPFMLLFMFIDYKSTNVTGTGITYIAHKK